MVRTEYAVLTTEELTSLAQTRAGATHMEIELAQRLQLAADKIVDMDADLG